MGAPDDPNRQLLEMFRVIRFEMFDRLEKGTLDYQRSIATLQKHLATARQLQNPRLLGQTYNALGYIENDLGHFQQAETYFMRGLDEIEGYGLLDIKGSLYVNIGEAFRRQGHYHQALDAYSLAQVFLDRLDPPSPAWVTAENNKGQSFLSLQAYEIAQACFEQVQARIDISASNAHGILIETYTGLAEIALAGGDFATAWTYAHRAEDLCKGRNFALSLARTYLTKAHIASADGSVPSAKFYRACRDVLHRYALPAVLARFLLNEALYQQHLNNLDDTHRLAEEALAIFEERGMQQEADIARTLLNRG